MRVVVYTDSVYREAGGSIRGEIAFNLFLAEMASLAQLTVVGRLDRGAGAAAYPLPPSVRFVAVPYYASLADLRAGLVSVVGSVKRFWRALDDADHAWLFGPYLHALLFALLALMRGRRVVLGVRQDFPAYVRMRRPAQRWMHVAADALELAWRTLARMLPVIVVGADLGSRYRRAKRMLPITVSLISRADVGAGEATNRAYDADLTLLSVGRLDEEKNPLLLADVLAILRREDPRWRMVVCGDGPMREELRARLAALGLSEAVVLRGHVPLHDGLLELYRTSHVFLHVSWTEGVPQVLVEAFASGLPVVATAVGGVRDAVGGAALLIAPGDSLAAAKAVALVATDHAVRERLVRTGFAEARAHTIDIELGRVLDFIAANGRVARRVARTTVQK